MLVLIYQRLPLNENRLELVIQLLRKFNIALQLVGGDNEFLVLLENLSHHMLFLFDEISYLLLWVVGGTVVVERFEQKLLQGSRVVGLGLRLDWVGGVDLLDVGGEIFVIAD